MWWLFFFTLTDPLSDLFVSSQPHYRDTCLLYTLKHNVAWKWGVMLSNPQILSLPCFWLLTCWKFPLEGEWWKQPPLSCEVGHVRINSALCWQHTEQNRAPWTGLKEEEQTTCSFTSHILPNHDVTCFSSHADSAEDDMPYSLGRVPVGWSWSWILVIMNDADVMVNNRVVSKVIQIRPLAQEQCGESVTIYRWDFWATTSVTRSDYLQHLEDKDEVCQFSAAENGHFY